MNGDLMSPLSRKAIADAQAQHMGIFVSPITAWEIATLASRGRISLSLSPSAWFDTLLALPGIRLAAMPPSILITSADLPGRPPRDPADRIIAATARELGYDIITRDAELTAYASSGHIQVIVC
jgi:PIN domain nuclease of toxin-antitoxin system